MASWAGAGGGGGMLGGVARGCVFTSAGESGIAAALPFLSVAGLPFLGPWGAEQLVDAKSLLPSTGDARDMELECRQETESWLWVQGRQPSRGQSGARAQAMP